MTKSATQLPLLPTSSPAAGEILNGLNDRQKQVVVERHQCLIVLAGPGSGKTRVLTHRIAYLIKEGVDPYNILAVTFTNKAAREMRTRLENLLDAGRAKAVTARTFHSFGALILRIEMPHLIPLLPNLMFTTMDRRDFKLPPSRLSNDFSIYDSSDQLALMTRIIKDRLNLDPKRFKPRDVHAAVSRWKNMGLTPANVDLIRAAEDDPMTRIYRNAYLLYQADLLAANALDFDDLILYPLLLFRNQTDRLRRYQDRFRHILIDEYQDTNTVQYELANLMAAHNLYIVGDPDQAIYGFRCRDARNVQRLMQEHPRHRLVLLEQNYRSVAPILLAANKLIEYNTQRVPKRLWTTQTSPDSHIFPHVCVDEVTEAEQVARLIKEAATRGVSYGEMAVLTRINAMSREIERALLNNGVPYELFSGVAFFERIEVKDTLSYLQFVYNGDQVAFQRIANKPKRGLGDVAVKAIINAAALSGGDLLGWLDRLLERGQGLAESDPGWQKVTKDLKRERVRAGQMFQLWKFAEAILTVRRLAEKDAAAGELVQQVIAILRSHLETLENFDERMENVQELLTVAARVETTGLPGLAEFLEQTALGTPEDDFEGTNKVAVATMHAAKGLEFELVFIIGVEDEICPLKRSIEETGQDGVEEERRLFYVAVTRAKKELYLLRAHQRTLFGNTMDNYPSPYFEEMDLDPFGDRQKSTTKGRA